jgi:hypothetical protein
MVMAALVAIKKKTSPQMELCCSGQSRISTDPSE